MSHVALIVEVATVVMVVAWLLGRFVLARPASQDLAWRVALVAVALTPALAIARSAWSSWQWGIGVWPASPTVVVESNDAPRELGAALPGPINRHLDEPEEVTYGGEMAPAPAVRAKAPLALAPAPAELQTSWNWRALLAAVWSAGCFCQIVRMIRSARRGRVLLRSSIPVEDPGIADVNAWAAWRTGLRKPVALVQNGQIDIPVVCGLWQPRIVLPHWLQADGERPQLRAALLHECGHVRRRDLAWELLLKVVVGAIWWHPLVHLMARELRRLREAVCDNFVLAEESAPSYAELLLRLSVGTRLRDSGLVGLAMLARTHQLEDRVEELLSPDRPTETQPVNSTRRLLVWTTAAALLAVVFIRFERVAGAPPAGRRPKETARKMEADGQLASPREVRFQIVDASDRPVAGATVTPWALLISEGSCLLEETQVAAAKSGTDGVVTVPFTKDMETIASGVRVRAGAGGIQQIGLRVDHPDYPVWSEYAAVGPDTKVVLRDATTIEVRARRRGEAAPAVRLYPLLSPTSASDWHEADGLLTVRRVDVVSERGSRWLQVVQVPENGPAWISEPVDLKHIAGNPIAVDAELIETIRIQGVLGDMVPRPIKNGRVMALVSYGDKNRGTPRPSWSATAEIAADGTFVLESLPPSEHLQIMALCDGWMSRSPTKEEVAAYAAEHGFPGEKPVEPNASMMTPQLHHVTAASQPLIAMEPTAACKVTVLGPQGKPLPKALVQFFPNQLFYGHGTTLLGTSRDMGIYVREKLASGDTRDTRVHQPDAGVYTQTTNADGEALIAGLPVPSAAPPFRQAQFVVTCEGFVAVPNAEFGDPGEFPFPILVATLSPGKTAQVTVRMIPQPRPDAESRDAVGGAEVPAGRVNALSGTVVDESGRPLPGAQVLIGNEDEPRIRTDKTGRFFYKFDHWPFGEGEPAFVPAKVVAASYAPRLVDLVAGLEEQVVTLQNGTYFEGVVRNPDGTPAANVRVRAWHEWRTSIHLGMSQDVPTDTLTDAEGRYKLLVDPADYVIVVGNSSEAIAWLPELDTRAGDERQMSERLLISANEARRLDVQLEAGVDFRARIFDSLTGKPVAGMIVDCRAYPGLDARSDASGLVVIPSLPARNVDFQIWPRGYSRMQWIDPTRGPAESPGMVSVRDRIPLKLQPNMPEVTILIESSVNVSGVVVDPDGNPLSDAAVRLVRAASPALAAAVEGERDYAYTKADGSFSIELPASGETPYNLMVHDGGRKRTGKGEFEWRTWANGVGPRMKTVGGQTVDNLELRVARPGTIRGRVVDAGGKPVAGVALQSIAADGLEGMSHNPHALSDREGRFELRLVRPGRHWLCGANVTRLPSGADKSQAVVAVQAGATTDAGDVVIAPAD